MGRREHDGDRGVRMLQHIVAGRLDRIVAVLDALAVALVGERPVRPAFVREHARLEACDIAGENAAVGIGDEIEVGAGLARPLLDHPHQQRQAAALIGTRQVLHLLVDRVLGLRGEHAHRQRRHVATRMTAQTAKSRR